jgi:hypothetical protein
MTKSQWSFKTTVVVVAVAAVAAAAAAAVVVDIIQVDHMINKNMSLQLSNWKLFSLS